MRVEAGRSGLGIALAIYLFLPFNSFSFIGVKGSGNVIKENRELSAFNAIDVGSAFHVFIKIGEPQSLLIETDDNLIPLIETKVKNGELTISTKKNITTPETMNVYITMAKLTKIELSGASKLIAEDILENDKMEIDLSGASRIKAAIKTHLLELDLSGASNASLSGHSTNLNIDASGASNLKLSELEVAEANIDCSGASNIWLWVLTKLEGEASGASNIYYKGDPQQVNVETSGAASVSRK